MSPGQALSCAASAVPRSSPRARARGAATASDPKRPEIGARRRRARSPTRATSEVNASTESEKGSTNGSISARSSARVHVRVADTRARAEAAARVCGVAFAQETRAFKGARDDKRRSVSEDAASSSGGFSGTDFVDDVVDWVGSKLDDWYASSITKELTHLTTFHIEERKRAGEELRRTELPSSESNNVRKNRLRAKRQCLTLISRFEDGGGYESWIGSATLRVCAPEALLPEPFPSIKPRVPYVSNVAVRAEARGRGAASSMLDKCERAARSWGYDHLWLHVDVCNQSARAMYERRGYVVYGEDPWWYGFGGILGPRRVLLRKRVV